MNSRIKPVIIAVMVFALASPALGAETVDRAKFEQLLQLTKQLSRRVEQLEKRLEKYEMAQKDAVRAKEEVEAVKKEAAELSRIKEALGHLELSGGVTGVIQGTVDKDDNNPEKGDSTDAAFTADLNLATHFGRYGSFYIHLEGGDGEGLNDDVASFSVPNYDAYATENHKNQTDLTISEAFYEFSFLEDRFLFDVGKMDVSVLFDENEAAGDETTQFLSNIFVKSMGLTIPEPDHFYCPGFMLKLAPVQLLEFRTVGAAVEDNNWEDVFDHGFMAWQLNLRPTIKGKPGNYRFYGWLDGRNHLKGDDLATANARTTPTYDDPLADKIQTGWGLSFDQETLQGVTAFGRYSQTEDDLARWNGDEGSWEIIPFDRVWSAGLQFSGSLWSRENDAFGVAYGQTLLTDDYQATNRHTADEHYLEAYYRLALHERFALTGDLQWINNAGGNSRADDIYILGLRSQLDF